MHAPAAISRVLALGAIVLVAATTAPASAAPTSPASAPEIDRPADVQAVEPGDIGRQFYRPSAKYLDATCFMRIPPGDDFTTIDRLNRCGTVVTFSFPMERYTVPQSWGDWGERPYVEYPRPRLLTGIRTVTFTFDEPVDIFGVEVDPMADGTYDITATYLRDGEVIGSITRAVSGMNGARLLAARAHGTTAVTYSSVENFGVARLRLPRSARLVSTTVQPNGGLAPF